jgi:release factor glutamine methyltransferase
VPDPDSVLTLHALLLKGERLLHERKIDSPSLSVQLLCAHALNTDRLDILVSRNRQLTREQWAAAWELLLRRAAGEPVAYLLGYKEFYGHDFLVDAHVLVPRPETELLIDVADGAMPHDRPFAFVDLGTGSGILAIMTALLRPRCTGVAVDTSLDALEIARENAVRHSVESRITFLQGNFCEPLRSARFDLVLTNPPYLSEQEHGGVSREVSGFEPRQALCSGPSGMECIETIIGQAPRIIKKGGMLAMEIGSSQADETRQMLEESGCFSQITIHRDLAGKDRVVTARREHGKLTTSVVGITRLGDEGDYYDE